MAARHSTGKAPAFQFYPKDFLADANVLAMSLSELGAYWKLTCICWNEGSLPADTKSLARLLGIPQGHASKLWPAIAPCFRERDNRLTHPRLESERKKQAEYRAKQADNGRKGGRPSGKGLGSSGETQTQPEKSSPISVLQCASATTSKTTTPRGAPIHPRRNLNAAWEGSRGLYVVQGQHQKFAALLNSPNADAELFAWYASVAAEWTTGGKAALNPGTDMVKFWDARHAERWPVADLKPTGTSPAGKWRPS